MTFEVFLERVGSEPPRSAVRIVSRAQPGLLAKAAKPGGMSMVDFLAAASRTSAPHEMRYGHLLGLPARRTMIEQWATDHPSHPLPDDLTALVARANGIHLWANLESGRSYVGLAPIEEWDVARVKMFGATANRGLLDDRFLAISYHQDGASFLVLDVLSGQYFLMDSAGPDTTSPVGATVDALLDWLWESRILPKP